MYTNGRTKHGMHKTSEYNSWVSMKSRCYNSNSEGYELYGGRGIAVCTTWYSSFEAFFADMGYKPHPSYSIEREDVDDHYYPGNCRWATPREQSNNRRNTLYYRSADGGLLPNATVAQQHGLSSSAMYYRVKNDVPVDQPYLERLSVDYRGDTIRLHELALKSGINYHTLWDRLYNQEMTLDEALALGPYQRPTYECYGEQLSLAEASKRYQVSKPALKGHIKKGRTLTEAVDYLVKKAKEIQGSPKP